MQIEISKKMGKKYRKKMRVRKRKCRFRNKFNLSKTQLFVEVENARSGDRLERREQLSGGSMDLSDITETSVDLTTANEEESKHLILRLLGDNKVESELSVNYEEDANLLQDLDLVILASPPEDYKTYTQLLRREYDNMNDDSYDLMRLKSTLITENTHGGNETSTNVSITSDSGNGSSVAGRKLTKKWLNGIKKPFNKAQASQSHPLKRKLLKAKKSLIAAEVAEELKTMKASNGQPCGSWTIPNGKGEKKDRAVAAETAADQEQSAVVEESVGPLSSTTYDAPNASQFASAKNKLWLDILADEDNDDDDEDNKGNVDGDCGTDTSSLEEGELTSTTLDATVIQRSIADKIVIDSSDSEADDDDCIILDATNDLESVNSQRSCDKRTKSKTFMPFYANAGPSNGRNKITNKKTTPQVKNIAAAKLSFKDSPKRPLYDRSSRKGLLPDSLSDIDPNSSSEGRTLDGDYIVIDETFEDSTLVSEDASVVEKDQTVINTLNASAKNDCSADDSVIFISETKAPPESPRPPLPALTDYIPLASHEVPNPLAMLNQPNQLQTPLSQGKRFNYSLFNTKERKELREYNNNAYNPRPSGKPPSNKRMIIIDGSNVAYQHSNSRGFSVLGLQICIEYFERLGHEVKAVVPQFRINRFKSTDPELLAALHRAGKVMLTPCKNLPGMTSISYDDRFVLQLACELDAAVVSNDNYRDLINENAAFKKIIENRVIGFTFCNDIFMIAKDPYGRWGPSLETILHVSPK